MVHDEICIELFDARLPIKQLTRFPGLPMPCGTHKFLNSLTFLIILFSCMSVHSLLNMQRHVVVVVVVVSTLPSVWSSSSQRCRQYGHHLIMREKQIQTFKFLTNVLLFFIIPYFVPFLTYLFLPLPLFLFLFLGVCLVFVYKFIFSPWLGMTSSVVGSCSVSDAGLAQETVSPKNVLKRQGN